ncbi:hypothetical protein ACFLWE_00435 [Chloroflexota bacterium]
MTNIQSIAGTRQAVRNTDEILKMVEVLNKSDKHTKRISLVGLGLGILALLVSTVALYFSYISISFFST